MSDSTWVTLPANFDRHIWADRWDRMQERYLVRRSERFAVMAALIRATQAEARCIVDLGCGPGSTMLALLEAFPVAEVIGVDLDPTLLPLAEARLAHYGERVRLVQADIRKPEWVNGIPQPVDAIVSATALHWLNGEELSALYRQLAHILHPGGIFLNADHVPSAHPAIQQDWEQHREEMRREEGHGDAEDWYQFWQAYGETLEIDIPALLKPLFGDWHGEEQTLSWHFDHLRSSGFTVVDCFWRCDCDAIYGGILGQGASK